MAEGQFCGRCRHGVRIPGDVHQVSCRGAPPTVVPVPQVKLGQVVGLNMQSVFPTMQKSFPGCGMWQAQAVPEVTDAPERPDFAGVDLSAFNGGRNGNA